MIILLTTGGEQPLAQTIKAWVFGTGGTLFSPLLQALITVAMVLLTFL